MLNLMGIIVFQVEAQDGMIRVQAPDLTKSSCLIQLDDQMTAGDIVDRFRRDYGSGQMGHRYALFTFKYYWDMLNTVLSIVRLGHVKCSSVHR